MGACTEITLSAWMKAQGDGDVGIYTAATAPNLGTAATDGLQLEFYGSGAGAGLNGENKGTFDLSAGIDNNYSTCARCFRIFEDPMVPGRTFFQQSGTLTVGATSDQLNGTLHGTLSNVTLVQVTINTTTFVSTPVPGGACLHITSATVDVVPPAVPAAWACNPAYYNDGSCDCGCGVIDLDCASANVSACDYCDDTGSCNTADCPGTIKTTNNAVCGP
jgi:hypothetical protein